MAGSCAAQSAPDRAGSPRRRFYSSGTLLFGGLHALVHPARFWASSWPPTRVPDWLICHWRPPWILDLFADCGDRAFRPRQRVSGGQPSRLPNHSRWASAELLGRRLSLAKWPCRKVFKTLKHEFLGEIKVYAGYRQLWKAVNISIFGYNQQRYHSSLGTTPNAYALKNAKTPLNLTTIKPLLKKAP